MTPAGKLLAEEIRSHGPVSFRRFMEVALYHPDHGYYRRQPDPFGKSGDFYTAEQLQPVFGILLAARLRPLMTGASSVVELGAGRGEMAQAFRDWQYLPVELGAGALPEQFRGIVFSNEFFDALPVEVAVFDGAAFREMRVDFDGQRFRWVRAGAVREEVEAYLDRYFPPPEAGAWYEINLEALGWLEQAARSLASGHVVTIDYGYTRREAARFGAGTLMAYRRHTAREDILEVPGEQDITAHVNFTALEERGAELGLVRVAFQTLARTLVEAGEADQFASALAAPNEEEARRRRLQLKTLLFGMGETFRVLIQRKGGK